MSKEMIGCFVILFIVLALGCFMIRKLTRKTKKKIYNDIANKKENEELVKFIRENSEDEEFAKFVEKTLEDSDKLIDIKIEKDDK